VSALPLAVAVGDPAGVGPIVAVEAIARFPSERFLVFGDAAALRARAGWGALERDVRRRRPRSERRTSRCTHRASRAGAQQRSPRSTPLIDAVLEGRARRPRHGADE
jgi:4-hydroxy-L-threonine phosphate dehydrogenase PdxA